MKILSISSLGLLLLVFSAFAQAPDTIWTSVIGGIADDEFYCATPTTDGGYICSGSTLTNSAGDDDLFPVKTDAAGNPVWQLTLGGTLEDDGGTVFQTPDGGYIVCGSTESYGAGEEDIWLVKVNASGGTVWTRTYGGTGDDTGGAMARASDGGFVLSGYTTSFGAGAGDVYLVKVNASGDTVWTRTYGSAAYSEGGAGIMPTPDGGFIVACYTDELMPNIYVAHYLLKVDANGNEQWHRVHQAGVIGYVYSAIPTSDGGYFSSGFSQESPGSPLGKIYALKTDASGQEVWHRFIGDSINIYYGLGAVQTTDGSYLITGQKVAYTMPPTSSFLVLKLGATGNILYEYTLPYTRQRVGYSIVPTNDGNYIIAGLANMPDASDSHNDGYLVKFADGVVSIKGGEKRNPPNFILHPVHPNPFNPAAAVCFQLQSAGSNQACGLRHHRTGSGGAYGGVVSGG